MTKTDENITKQTALAGSHQPFAISIDDTHTKIVPNADAKIKLDKPVLITGFPDVGMVGSISINHIIEQLAMHQIAFVESKYVMPAALFIGKKFRHPFRIYANDKGNVCVMICEVPIMLSGVQAITNTIINWANNSQSAQVIVVGGIAPSNFTPPFLLDRKALLLQNTLGDSRQSEEVVSSGIDSLKLEKQTEQNDINNISAKKMMVPDSALLSGLAGSLLSSCSTRQISCTAVMVPTLGDAPDPEGAVIVLEALNEIIPKENAIDTSGIRKDVEEIKKRLTEYMKMHQRHLAEYELATTGGRPAASMENIYK